MSGQFIGGGGAGGWFVAFFFCQYLVLRLWQSSKFGGTVFIGGQVEGVEAFCIEVADGVVKAGCFHGYGGRTQALAGDFIHHHHDGFYGF